jgi:hypothetical protein
MTTGFQPTTMMVIDPDTYPSLASLLGLDFLREVAEREVPWQHPLGMMLAWESQAREQYLTAIDHAAELMVSVLERSPQKARAWIAGSLKKRESFDPTIAELVCGARLERLGARPVAEPEGDDGGRPDYQCSLAGEQFFVEVYAPGASPKEDVIDDVWYHLRDCTADCLIVLSVKGMKRDSTIARSIAVHLKALISELKGSADQGASFWVPPHGTLADWETSRGSSGFSWAVGEEPMLSGRVDLDGVPGIRLGGIANPRPFDPAEEARRELAKLGQLQKGQRNVLVVDLSAKNVTRFLLDAYLEAAHAAFDRHVELSAVLFTWRFLGLEPALNVQHELHSGYVVVPTSNPGALQLSESLVSALGTPNLLSPRPRA